MLFDKYIHYHAVESKLYSVDINKSATDYARTFIGPKTALTSDDSVKYLAKLTADFLANGRTADLVYLDAYDLDWHYWYPSAAHHLMELCSVVAYFKKRYSGRKSMTVRFQLTSYAENNNAINFISPPIIGGKGRMVAEFAARVGAKVEFSEYQAGWSGF